MAIAQLEDAVKAETRLLKAVSVGTQEALSDASRPPRPPRIADKLKLLECDCDGLLEAECANKVMFRNLVQAVEYLFDELGIEIPTP